MLHRFETWQAGGERVATSLPTGESFAIWRRTDAPRAAGFIKPQSGAHIADDRDGDWQPNGAQFWLLPSDDRGEGVHP